MPNVRIDITLKIGNKTTTDIVNSPVASKVAIRLTERSIGNTQNITVVS